MMTGRELLDILSGMTDGELELPAEVVMGVNERHVFEISDVKVDPSREIIRITPG